MPSQSAEICRGFFCDVEDFARDLPAGFLEHYLTIGGESNPVIKIHEGFRRLQRNRDECAAKI